MSDLMNAIIFTPNSDAALQNLVLVLLSFLIAILGSLVVNGARHLVTKMSQNFGNGSVLKSLVQIPSNCSNCGRRIIIRDWFPLFDLPSNSKSCKHCVQSLEPRDLLLDIGVVIFSALVPLVFGWSVFTATIIWIVWICVIISIVDLRFQIVPEFACWLLLFTGLLWSPFELDPMLRIAGAAIATILMWLSLACVGLIKNEDTHAGGDVAIASAAGAWVGIYNLPMFLIISSILFGSYGFMCLKRHNQSWTPMAPALSIGLVVTLLTSLLF